MPHSPELTLPRELLAGLRERYAESHRHYHSIGHIEALLRWFGPYRHLAREPALIEAAIWLHDAVYDTRRQDNEALSAALAHDELSAVGWAPAAVQRVAALVLATQHHEAEGTDADAWLFLDLDLSVLGQDAGRYAAYADAVRREYVWVVEADYRRGRAAVLRRFIDRPAIYRTPALHGAWEAAARHNLQHELGRLAS